MTFACTVPSCQQRKLDGTGDTYGPALVSSEDGRLYCPLCNRTYEDAKPIPAPSLEPPR